MRNFIVTMSVLVMSVVAFTSSASAAGAAWAYRNGGLDVPNRSCASVNCPVGRWVKSNSKIYVICWVDTQYAVGNYGSARWFRVIAPITGGYDGWMHSSYVYYQPAVPYCWN